MNLDEIIPGPGHQAIKRVKITIGDNFSDNLEREIVRAKKELVHRQIRQKNWNLKRVVKF